MAEIRIPSLENDLKNNLPLIKTLYADPKPVLKNYGLEVDDDAATKIKDLLKTQIDPEATSIPATQAVYLAIKI